MAFLKKNCKGAQTITKMVSHEYLVSKSSCTEEWVFRKVQLLNFNWIILDKTKTLSCSCIPCFKNI